MRKIAGATEKAPSPRDSAVEPRKPSALTRAFSAVNAAVSDQFSVQQTSSKSGSNSAFLDFC